MTTDTWQTLALVLLALWNILVTAYLVGFVQALRR